MNDFLLVTLALAFVLGVPGAVGVGILLWAKKLPNNK